MAKKKTKPAPLPVVETPPVSYRNLVTVLLIVISAITFAAYTRSLSCGFTNWDDNEYTYYTFQQLQKLHTSFCDGLASFFFVPNGKGGSDFAYVKGNFHPLSMISMTIDYALSPASPTTIPPIKASWLHLTNILFHLANTLLVFWLISMIMQFLLPSGRDKAQAGKNRLRGLAVAAGTALLFGVHPLHVESVTWISERKDVLYAFWALLCLISWLFYIRRNRPVWYLLALAFFLLSHLSKAQAAFLAPVLLLMDITAGRRLNGKALLEKAPFFLLALAFGLVAVKAQIVGNAVPAAQDSLMHRIIFASTAFTMYLVKTALPAGLSTLYPYPDVSGGMPAFYYLTPLPVLLVAAGMLYGLKRSRAILFGLGFFSAAVFLILQLLPVGRAMMADRYMYLASIGLFFIVCYGIESVPDSYLWAARSALVVCALILAGMTSSRSAIWQDSLSLWNDAVEKSPTASIAFHNRAQVRFEMRDYRGAIKDETEAIKLEPTLADAYYNRANSELTLGDPQKSLEDNTICLKYNPKHFYAYYLRGSAKMSLGRTAEAMADFDSTITLCPQLKLGFMGRAMCREATGNWPGAISDYTEAIKLDNGFADCWFRRGIAYAHQNDQANACNDFRTAAQLGNPAAEERARALCGK